ncbi:hypothetical protein [Streptomyces sp. NBRC 110035]|uniref:hypothetical protein n=1 Tax=Streptomyces sp. NBRC 110035 TaxID=1547867 RepID=UPI0005A74565|nr:hypothetical protein [Streptomyces sp. NBRC 110035]
MKRKLVDHFAVAAHCRATPGQWQPVGEYNSSSTASCIEYNIRTARVPRSGSRSAYLPAGAYEATRVLTEYGARVEARYVGKDGETA